MQQLFVARLQGVKIIVVLHLNCKVGWKLKKKQIQYGYRYLLKTKNMLRTIFKLLNSHRQPLQSYLKFIVMYTTTNSLRDIAALKDVVEDKFGPTVVFTDTSKPTANTTRKFSLSASLRHTENKTAVSKRITPQKLISQGVGGCGITFDWKYHNGFFDVSMTGYVQKVIQKFQHQPPKSPQFSPFPAALYVKYIRGQRQYEPKINSS